LRLIGGVKSQPKIKKAVIKTTAHFDHRVVDGAMATIFMNGVKEYLEDPNLMLLSMI
jgi:pyruvate/2-oxoglutarate dehydrogenase complex dihydrolipoamide acyltransferase (E2) component